MKLRCLLGLHKYEKDYLTDSAYELVCVHCKKIRDVKKARKKYASVIFRK